jgi:hypothetical protein
MAASNFYEVRCESCRTSFPPETKRCIHCGGSLGSGLGRWAPGAAPAGAGAGDDEEALPPSRARNLLWLVTAVLAVVMSVLRNCTQG